MPAGKLPGHLLAVLEGGKPYNGHLWELPGLASGANFAPLDLKEDKGGGWEWWMVGGEWRGSSGEWRVVGLRLCGGEGEVQGNAFLGKVVHGYPRGPWSLVQEMGMGVFETPFTVLVVVGYLRETGVNELNPELQTAVAMGWDGLRGLAEVLHTQPVRCMVGPQWGEGNGLRGCLRMAEVKAQQRRNGFLEAVMVCGTAPAPVCMTQYTGGNMVVRIGSQHLVLLWGTVALPEACNGAVDAAADLRGSAEVLCVFPRTLVPWMMEPPVPGNVVFHLDVGGGAVCAEGQVADGA